MRSFQAILKASAHTAYAQTFPFEGLDPVPTYDENNFSNWDRLIESSTIINGKKVENYDPQFIKYLYHPLTIITSILGISNRMKEQTSEDNEEEGLQQTPGRFLSNLLTGTPAPEKMNIFLLIPLTIWNIGTLIPRIAINLVLNTAKFFTVFTFGFLTDVFRRLAIAAERRADEKDNPFKRINPHFKRFLKVCSYAAKLAQGIFGIPTFIARAIISPIDATRMAWSNGQFFANSTELRGKLLGGLLATLSIAITVVGCIIFPPLGFKFLAVHVLPAVYLYAKTHLPAWIIKAATAVKNVLEPIFSTVGKAITKAITPALKAIGAEYLLTISPSIVGFAALFGITLPSIGPIFNRISDRITNWLHKETNDSKYSINALKQKWNNWKKKRSEKVVAQNIPAPVPQIVPVPQPIVSNTNNTVNNFLANQNKNRTSDNDSEDYSPSTGSSSEPSSDDETKDKSLSQDESSSDEEEEQKSSNLDVVDDFRDPKSEKKLNASTTTFSKETLFGNPSFDQQDVEVKTNPKVFDDEDKKSDQGFNDSTTAFGEETLFGNPPASINNGNGAPPTKENKLF